MNIPKVLHKVIILDSDKYITNKLRIAINSFIEKNPDYELRIYYKDDCIKYIKEHYEEIHLEIFNKLIPYAYKCDFFRYLLLYNEGGYYSDMRQTCLQSFDKCFPKDMEWFSCIDYPKQLGYMCNGFICSIPKHKWLKRAINATIYNVQNNYYGKDPLSITGPALFGKVCNLDEKEDNWYIGIHERKSHLDDGYLYTHLGEKIIDIKYRKSDGKLYLGGDWSMEEGGNNYNDYWYNKNVYNVL